MLTRENALISHWPVVISICKSDAIGGEAVASAAVRKDPATLAIIRLRKIAVLETLLAVLPPWSHRIEKPFKQMLDEGVDLEMYYCLKTLQYHGPVTMSEFAGYVRMPKQQMTKMVNRLVEQGAYVIKSLWMTRRQYGSCKGDQLLWKEYY